MFVKFTLDDLRDYNKSSLKENKHIAIQNVLSDISSALVEIENYDIKRAISLEDYQEQLRELDLIYQKIDYLKKWLTNQRRVLKEIS